MKNGVEWNVLINDDKPVFEEGTEEFLRLFYDEQTIPVNNKSVQLYEADYEQYHQMHPNLATQWTKQEEVDMMLPKEEEEKSTQVIIDPPVPYGKVQPRFAQIEALEELEKSFEEGYSKSLVVMATGLGKTYLAAFFAKKFKRVLFVAHREEILKQAEKSFKMVNPQITTGLYNGVEKVSDAEAVFASIFTLSRQKHMNRFNPNDFDLIVMDEFHLCCRKYLSESIKLL